MKVKPIDLDGRTGEGGGQLVRVAVGLAALTSQPVRITHVRGNREGPRGGGLKAQHVTSIQWLADVTGAHVEGLCVGSKTLTFIPKTGPADLAGRSFEIKADTDAASALLILQAILPFVLFAAGSDDKRGPLSITIHGGTNVQWSPSYEYFDQVLMPALESHFAIRIDRKLSGRSWSQGRSSPGSIALTVHPVAKGGRLRCAPPPKHPACCEVKTVDISVLAPGHAHEQLQGELFRNLGELYPEAELRVRLVEDSGSDQKWNVLLVAESHDGIRWGRDVLRGMPKKMKPSASASDAFARQVASAVCRDLHEETELGGQVDEHLQDQLVVLQALCEGYSSFPRGGESPPGESGPEASLSGALESLSLEGDRLRKDKTRDPFGHGSMHTQTARWVASQLLPAAEFYNKGNFVKGVGFSL
ncbi:RNA 3'-terminal phosphate cyclase [Cordyceps fumosorosea ARSEF 2679]|uniref:RNA 3'-terminal phosphate cyclase n=1 Tax=Cordyceps fumosorosea (strain ARSEF 2679) TaxID=1081104 RepID=A0A162ME55_CORFA|nr:RNA 3'-terminal phosphate cyclase [Cordyceps fumosorosea ARSEF 2679]OAA54920.1 RNA 3'-terminal phosphate cyclase [Cordyceps fumosorosea ARSEF 2679]